MKNRIPSGGAVKLMVVAFLTLLLFAGCAGCPFSPKGENLSMAKADLQPSPSDSPKFTSWGPGGEDFSPFD